MRILLFLCLFLFTAAISFAQTSKEYLYHIKFYKWEWDCYKYIGWDTIEVYDRLSGEPIGDSAIWDTVIKYTPAGTYAISYPLPRNFTENPQEVVVTSIDGTKKFEINYFNICRYDGEWRCAYIMGSTLKPEDLERLRKIFTAETMRIWLEIDLKNVVETLRLKDSPIKVVR